MVAYYTGSDFIETGNLAWVKGQGHSDVISIFTSKFSVNFPTADLSSLMSDQNEIWFVP